MLSINPLKHFLKKQLYVAQDFKNLIFALKMKLGNNLFSKFHGASNIQITFKYNNLSINEIRSQPVTQIPCSTLCSNVI